MHPGRGGLRIDTSQSRTLKWMMRRWLRAGVTSTWLTRGTKAGWSARLAHAGRGIGRIGAGSILVVVTAVARADVTSPRWRARYRPCAEAWAC